MKCDTSKRDRCMEWGIGWLWRICLIKGWRPDIKSHFFRDLKVWDSWISRKEKTLKMAYGRHLPDSSSLGVKQSWRQLWNLWSGREITVQTGSSIHLSGSFLATFDFSWLCITWPWTSHLSCGQVDKNGSSIHYVSVKCRIPGTIWTLWMKQSSDLVPELATNSGRLIFHTLSFKSKHTLLDSFSEGTIVAQGG